MAAETHRTVVLRDYDGVAMPSPGGTLEERLSELTEALWERFAATGVSWIGFYFAPGHQLDDGRTVGPEEMLLGPCRDKPACSPIGLHGACGQSWRAGKPLVVRDVRELGENYVACDPRDQSEVVVPLFDESGRCYAVLDADSHDIGSFTDRDAAGLTAVCRRAGLTAH